MQTVKPRYSKEEFARRGEEIFSRQVSAQVQDRDPDCIVAIDIESGDFEVSGSLLEAVDRLHERRAGAQVWIRRVGSAPVMRFGGRLGAD